MKYCFNYKGSLYDSGTIIKIYNNESKKYKYKTHFIFEYVNDDNMYCFRALYDHLEYFLFTKEELNNCIESIVREGTAIDSNANQMIDPKYIDGISEAWAWYILAMIGSLLLSGAINVIGMQILASVIFWSWRNKKIKGGK